MTVTFPKTLRSGGGLCAGFWRWWNCETSCSCSSSSFSGWHRVTWRLVEIIQYFSGLFNLFLIDILRILSKLPYWWGHWNSFGDLFPGLHFPFRQLKNCQSVLVFQDWFWIKMASRHRLGWEWMGLAESSQLVAHLVKVEYKVHEPRHAPWSIPAIPKAAHCFLHLRTENQHLSGSMPVIRHHFRVGMAMDLLLHTGQIQWLALSHHFPTMATHQFTHDSH